MANLKQELNIVLDAYAKEVEGALRDEGFLQGLGRLLVELIIKRTQSGYDIYSRRFGGYNRSYDKREAYKDAVKEYGRTKYASRSKTDKLQLTGNLLSAINSLKPKIVNRNGVVIVTGVYIRGSFQKKKAEGLGSTTGVARGGKRYSKKNWLFLGLAVRGAYVKKETEAINRYISKYIGEKLVKKINKKNR